MDRKTIVIGLDGTSFNLIGPWIESGELPAIKKIIENGVSGSLESCPPPVTSPNWKCYSTGKNPGKLGIFWWENINWEKREVTVPRKRTRSYKEIWDYLGEGGDRVGVVNTPLTYPPKPVEGVMVSGPPDGREEKYTYPENLKNWLETNYGYKINPRWLNYLEEGSQKAVDEILDMIETRFEVSKDLIKERGLDFLHLTIFYINTLHHFFWDDEPVKRGWKTIDENISDLLKEFSEANFFFLSDHGTNPIKRVFYANSWLENEGYLQTKGTKSSQFFHRMGINQDRLVKIARTLGLKDILKKITPDSLWSSVPSEAGTIEREHKTDRIDWEESTAIASGQGPVYVKNEKEREEILEKLEELEDPFTKKKIAEKVWKKEDIYSGEYFRKGPSLIIDQSPGTHIRGGIGKNKAFEKPSGWKAENKKDGIFMAYGPDIREGERLENISILDLAPTIFHLRDTSIPPGLDGGVLKEVFKEGSEPGERKSRFREEKRKEEEKRIKGKVRNLDLQG